jgi:squalene-hopene/tetraprenyl-beta-curcumene cyclase
LLAARTPDGHWEGELSGSALSTATAVIALAIVQREAPLPTPHSALRTALGWLAKYANADGGWGDTTQSLSNISTTALCWAAFGAVPGADEDYRAVVSRAETWLSAQIGSPPSPPNTHHASRITPLLPASSLAAALIGRYGNDRTFSAPILTACALAGRLGPGPEAWRHVMALPFELAACPAGWFAALRLPVVSYALPALIAIGQARHFHLPSRNPVARLARNLARERTLRILGGIQPGSGGFLEATPLTSFVVMSLAGSGQARHPVTEKGAAFLLQSQRADGCWPIDTNLATWVTTLAVDALAPQSFRRDELRESLNVEKIGDSRSSSLRGVDLRAPPPGFQSPALAGWLLGQQHRAEHPYTHAAPGGWAWTDLPGGVPDADDTAGALIALRQLGSGEEVSSAARAGVEWLLGLQNRDGGIPTFCRGWGKLPFDRSSADLTAHAVRAWLAWLEKMPTELRRRTERATARALRFLEKTQREDGSWTPLWFGNQFCPNDENPAYGTARVVRGLCAARGRFPTVERPLAKGITWLLKAQNKEGGWGGAGAVRPSVEETALAVEALAEALENPGPVSSGPSGLPPVKGANPLQVPLEAAVLAGAAWLVDRVESGDWKHPTPIGLYFAKLWYYERLYPEIFTVAALGRVWRGSADASPAR